MTLMNLEREIEINFVQVKAEETLGELVQAVSRSKRNLFPVVSPDNRLVGIVVLDDIRHIMFDQSQYEELKVREVMTLPPEIISTDDSMELVMNKFDESGAWNLPVTKEGKYLGFVSKSRLFSAYRALLRETILGE